MLIVRGGQGLSWPNWRRTHDDANAKNRRAARRIGGKSSAPTTPRSRSPATAAAVAFKYRRHRRAGRDSRQHRPHRVPRLRLLVRRRQPRRQVRPLAPGAILRTGSSSSATTTATSCSTARRSSATPAARSAPPAGCAMRSANCFRSLNRSSRHSTNTIGLDGRFHFYVHPNPENKILHTALVGEMNGLVHAHDARHAARRKVGHIRRPAGVHEIRSARADG